MGHVVGQGVFDDLNEVVVAVCSFGGEKGTNLFVRDVCQAGLVFFALDNGIDNAVVGDGGDDGVNKCRQGFALRGVEKRHCWNNHGAVVGGGGGGLE